MIISHQENNVTFKIAFKEEKKKHIINELSFLVPKIPFGIAFPFIFVNSKVCKRIYNPLFHPPKS